MTKSNAYLKLRKLKFFEDVAREFNGELQILNLQKRKVPRHAEGHLDDGEAK